MEVCKGRLLGISVAVAHGFFSGSLNILLKFLITTYSFTYLTLIQCLTSGTAALTLEGTEFAHVCCVQAMLALGNVGDWSVCAEEWDPISWGAGDLTGDPFGYVTGILAVIVHASYLVLIQKASADSDYGPLTAQYTIAVVASPILFICSIVSMDAIDMWTYEGWKNPYITGIFCTCILIGCAMNFTTLHCTYINSAVTTSFVGVVKSIATITVGMLAFSDVMPTKLFVAGVVVNTVGSITYCVVKYYETKKKLTYQDMDGSAKDEELPGEPYVEPAKPDGDTETLPNDLENVPNGSLTASVDEGPIRENKVAESIELERPGIPTDDPTRQSLSDSYVGVWRSIRTLNFFKKDTLLDNMEVQSP
ncbi:Solute carrier family 35 member D3 [Labeo rohita]|uniref:Solute carrier family 35 member D3 n=1 Tax=Labeo rohita TaxID=84645 RepID=A0ABQ8LNE1_LABRO|nr:Solute carrier family 35 member D3 [Labeo rohita]